MKKYKKILKKKEKKIQNVCKLKTVEILRRQRQWFKFTMTNQAL